ncbi:MAG: hypothetical protein QOK88_03605 [Nitrososphaeraceae archaeon]|nr:hypothetical protein [Nitrososphaeraceae archaeon]
MKNNMIVDTSDSDNELDRRPMTEEEIQLVLQKRRMRDTNVINNLCKNNKIEK